MSKSLKNFIRIRQIFDDGFTANNFRFGCLLSPYRSNLDFNFELLEEAKAIEKRFVSLLREICYLASSSPEIALTKRSTPESLQLFQKLVETQKSVRNHFADDFDTPSAIKKLLDLASFIHPLLLRADAASILPLEVLSSCGRFLVDILSTMGVDVSCYPPIHSIRKTKVASLPLSSNSMTASAIDISTPLAEELVSFRSLVRNSSIRSQKLLKNAQALSEADLKELKEQTTSLLQQCDLLREKFFPSLGFGLQV